MKFLFVTGNYKPAKNSGGPVNTVSQLAEHLVALGHHVAVVALNEDDGVPMKVPVGAPVLVEGVSVLYFRATSPIWRRLSGRHSGIRKWEPAAFGWLKQHLPKFDVIHLQVGLLHPARVVAKLARRHRKVLCYHQRGNLDPRRFGRLCWLKKLYVRIVEVPVLKATSVLFALSEREAVVFRNWCASAKVVRLPNGVEFDRWRKKPDNARSPGKSKIKGGPILLWSARWDLRKGPLEFVEATSILSRELPAATFLMVGPETGERVFRQVAARVKEVDLPNFQLFRGLPEADRKAFIHQANYFVLPTHGEGFSVGILEAMAAETVVVTTPEANFPELDDDKVGCIVGRSPQEIAQQIMLLEKDKTKRDQLAASASQYVQEHYGWGRITKNYLASISEKLTS